MKPAIGREFTEAEQIPGQDNVAILAHSLWRDRFASDPNVLGRKITLDGAALTIVGVMPEDFQYIPMGLGAGVHAVGVCAGKNGVARDPLPACRWADESRGWMSSARSAAMIAFQASLEKTYPATNTNRGVLVRTLQEDIDQQSGNSAVRIIFAIVTLHFDDGLRECGEPDDGALDGATKRNGRPAGHGRGTMAAGPATAGRDSSVICGRRGRGDVVCAVGRHVSSALDSGAIAGISAKLRPRGD